MQIKLIERLKKSNISVKELALKTGIDENTLMTFIYGESYEITVGNIKKICEALKCRAEEIFLYEE